MWGDTDGGEGVGRGEGNYLNEGMSRGEKVRANLARGGKTTRWKNVVLIYGGRERIYRLGKVPAGGEKLAL